MLKVLKRVLGKKAVLKTDSRERRRGTKAEKDETSRG